MGSEAFERRLVYPVTVVILKIKFKMCMHCYALELGDIPQKYRKEGIFVIPLSISSKKFYTGKLKYRKNTGIP